MKNTICASAIVCLLSSAAYAHPPSAIEVKAAGESVEITVAHAVKDPAGHYIDDIAVSVNGRKIITQKYSLQKDAAAQPAVYLIPGLKKGDKITVQADCNRIGELKREITVE